MAAIRSSFKLDVSIEFTVTESEARALDALAGYGDDAFIREFYERLGKAYMQQHEAGLRSFLKSIRDAVNPPLAVLDEARKVIAQNLAMKKGGA